MPKSAVKNEECFVFPEPKTPVNKNQYKKEKYSLHQIITVHPQKVFAV